MNIEELKRLAEAATPGPWYLRTNRHRNTDGTSWGWLDTQQAGDQNPPAGVNITWSSGRRSENNADFIAAANPAAVLDLIAEVEYRTGKAREHFDACMGCDEVLKRVTKQRDELLEALKDARDSIAGWGEYVPVYFQEKHGLVKELYDLDEFIDKADG